jgi:isopropylmalate/homocitrate/citramalate synthase
LVEGALSSHLHIVDCTLREGEQAAGVWFSVEEKLQLVDALAQAGVETLDAGMPAVSADERAFLSAAVGRTAAKIGASVRARADEVKLAIDCGVDEVFVICPVSQLHREKRLGLSEQALVERVTSLVEMIKAAGKVCNLVAEDASRAEHSALIHALGRGLEAGSDRLFLCDTVGSWTPSMTASVVATVRSTFPDAPLGVHCHNDFGMATANTVAAVEAGCDFPTATINGVGERAGNASLLEVALAGERLLSRDARLDHDALRRVSVLVERLTGLLVPQHQPVVGFNAFRHESGIHVDGILKDPANYEALSPGVVGREHAFVLGKHSGRALLRRFARDRGLSHDDSVLDRILGAVKEMQPRQARAEFDQLRRQIEHYNATCLGVPEQALERLFADHG